MIHPSLRKRLICLLVQWSSWQWSAWLKKDIPEGVLGGILTARDIANLNLKDTDLVVLSACHTDNGKATAEECTAYNVLLKRLELEHLY